VEEHAHARALARKSVISCLNLNINTFPSTKNRTFTSLLTHTRYSHPPRLLVNHLREHHRSRVVSSSPYLQEHFSKAQSSSSTMRASILVVALGAFALKAAAGAYTSVDTLSTTTTVTILSCHPTVTNCPVSLFPHHVSRVLRVVYPRDTS
jgi:hypothetical protein